MAPGDKDHIRRPLQTSAWSENVGVARFVKRGKTACATPTLFLLLPAKCVFKSLDAPSTVKYENWHVFNTVTIIDRNPHFNQAGYVVALPIIKMAYCYIVS